VAAHFVVGLDQVLGVVRSRYALSSFDLETLLHHQFVHRGGMAVAAERIDNPAIHFLHFRTAALPPVLKRSHQGIWPGKGLQDVIKNLIDATLWMVGGNSRHADDWNDLCVVCLCAITFRSGVLGQFHDGFTTTYIRTSVEIRGPSGWLLATNCVSQSPVGAVLLKNANGELELPLKHENLYVRTINAFKQASAGEGNSLSTGKDGVA
jgi:hypothetical protein